MGTVIRAEISEKNKYKINKHRHYELKHFCLQYPDWKKLYSELDGFERSNDYTNMSKSNMPSDPTYKCIELKNLYLKNVELIEQVAMDTDPELANYILKGVTEELSYQYLRSKLGIPCSRDTYYNRYRRFFWLLDKERN